MESDSRNPGNFSYGVPVRYFVVHCVLSVSSLRRGVDRDATVVHWEAVTIVFSSSECLSCAPPPQFSRWLAIP